MERVETVHVAVGAARVVRAIGTGDLFWTDDHYSTFHYMGRH